MPPCSRLLTLTLCVGYLTACDGGLGLESVDGIVYVVERFEVVEEHDEGAQFPVAYLRTELALINTWPDSVYLNYGHCAVELEGVAVGEQEGEGSWRSQARKTWPSSIPTACLAYGATARVGPGDTLRVPELRNHVALAEILADSLPPGSYAFDAMLRMGDGARVELGTIHLPPSRHPLPNRAVSRDGFRYEVEVDPGEGGPDAGVSLVLRVGYSAHSYLQPLERTLSRTCPVRILAFRGASDVLTIPQPEPAWAWPSSCGPGDAPVRLEPGESRTFEGAIDFAELAAAGVEPGDYFLMGLIDVDGRPLRVTAGELEVP